MPIQPTAHYAMGGIPTNVDAEVVIDENWTVLPGLYAAGETACVSVHGANRLGTNSLVDLVVFGRRGGMKIADYVKHADYTPLPANPSGEIEAEMNRIRDSSGKTRPGELRETMQKIMMADVSVFREEKPMTEALNTLRDLRERYQNDLLIDDRGQKFNTDLFEAWELGCLLDLAEITTLSAINRTESRGGHSREDYPKTRRRELAGAYAGLARGGQGRVSAGRPAPGDQHQEESRYVAGGKRQALRAESENLLKRSTEC